MWRDGVFVMDNPAGNNNRLKLFTRGSLGENPRANPAARHRGAARNKIVLFSR